MSIQAVSNVSLFQALQNNHGRRPDLRPITSAQQIDIAGADLTNQSHGFWQQRRAGLDQLGQALLAGNADAAQQAFDALVALGQNGPLRNGETFHRADRAQDFTAIGQALASGDLAGAQAALTDLASTFGHGISSGGVLPPGPPTLIPPQGGLPPGPPRQSLHRAPSPRDRPRSFTRRRRWGLGRAALLRSSATQQDPLRPVRAPEQTLRAQTRIINRY